jgi:hypothetical protein
VGPARSAISAPGEQPVSKLGAAGRVSAAAVVAGLHVVAAAVVAAELPAAVVVEAGTAAAVADGGPTCGLSTM